MLDTVLREVIRGTNEPLVLENAREKDVCECVGNRCYRDGVIGSIESETDKDQLCLVRKDLEGARRVRVETFLEAADACAKDLAAAKTERRLDLQDVELWFSCVVERLAEQGPYFD